MDVRPHEITDLERAEAEFTRQILANPEDVTARKVFADWLDDNYPERRVQAKYLREIRKHKFVRLVRDEGGWALKPQWVEHRGIRICWMNDGDGYTSNMALAEPAPPRSPRCRYWLTRIRRGWKVPRHIKQYGYSMMVGWFGVYTDEYLRLIAPVLEYRK